MMQAQGIAMGGGRYANTIDYNEEEGRQHF